MAVSFLDLTCVTKFAINNVISVFGEWVGGAKLYTVGIVNVSVEASFSSGIVFFLMHFRSQFWKLL